MDDVAILAAVDRVTKAHGISLQRVTKEKSQLMRAIFFVLKRFNPQFLTGYVTTIPFLHRSYVPEKWPASSLWRTMGHEGMHGVQAKRDGQLLFALKYLFPQVFGLLALLALLTPLWSPMVLCLGFLAFFLPWKARYRTNYELEAYYVSFAIDSMMGTDIATSKYFDYAQRHFTGSGYYWPAKLEKVRDRIRATLMAAEGMAQSSDVDGPDYFSALLFAIRTEIERQKA